MFTFKLVGQDGEKVEPETFVSTIPTWRAGDRIFVNPKLRYRVVEVLEGDGTAQAVLGVEPE